MVARTGVAVLLMLTGCRGQPAPEAPPPTGSAAAQTRAPATVDASVNADAEILDGAVAAAVDAEASVPPMPTPAGMLLVPAGTFTMGTSTVGEGDERPAHEVTVSAFYLDATEVTQAAYEQCVVEKVCAPPSVDVLPLTHPFRGPHKPVVAVSWFDASKYCAWRGARLPREAEFERAVRDDDGRRYPWGNDAPTHERAVFATSGPEDVATHPGGRGPYGHDDLAGNVWEWMDDDYDPFAYTRPTAGTGKPGSCKEIEQAQNDLRTQGKQGFTGSNPIPDVCEKSIRGGAYNYPPDGLRSTNRVHHPPRYKLKMTGIRCAKDAP